MVSASDSNADSFTLDNDPAKVLEAKLVAPVRSRLIASASVELQSDGTSATGFGLCQINHGLGQLHGALAPNGGSSVRSRTVLALNGAAVVDAGTYTIEVNCHKDGANNLAYFSGDLIVSAIPAAS